MNNEGHNGQYKSSDRYWWFLSKYTHLVVRPNVRAKSFPLKQRITQRRVSLVMVIVWTCAAAIGMPALFFYKYTERQWKNFLERFCSDVWPQTRNSDNECDKGYLSKSAYWVCVLVVLNWFPMVIMLVVYTIILMRLGKKKIIPSSGALSTSAIQQRSKKKV